MKTYFIILIFIHSIISNSVNADDCSRCEFDEYFNEQNGYGCYRKSVNETICTCPDRRFSTINQPCRICNRIDICGSQNASCSEKSPTFAPMKNGSHFACLCSANLLVIGRKCSEDPSTDSNSTTSFSTSTTTTNTISPISNSSTATTTTTPTKKPTSSTPQTATKCDGQSNCSHVFISPMLIILLNLVYFIKK